MKENKLYELIITMKSGRKYDFNVSETELDWLFDLMFERETGNFQNFASDEIINVSEIEYVKYQEVSDDTEV